MNQENIVAPLLAWYDQNKRHLPWREEIHPYKTWVSEIMLQQTRVDQAIDYFNRFMKRLPTIQDLANVDMDTLLKLWEGLGYYNRARNMKKMAEIVVRDYQGIIPSSYEEITKLPGIGAYTAGAILSIAYNKKIPCVDGNVLRVITRVTLDYSDIAKEDTKEKIKNELIPLLPDRVGDFNQALMELGALVCLPNTIPKCDICPLKNACLAYKEGKQELLPVKSSKTTKRKEKRTVFVLIYQDQVLLQKRDEKGLLASLYELPNILGHLSKKEVKAYLETQGYQIKSLQKGPSIKHIFSHLEWDLTSYIITLKEKSDGIWMHLEEKEKYSLPTAFKNILKGVKDEKR